MSKKLFRHYRRGHLHFVTFSCYRRLPLLRSVRARKRLVTILDEMRHRYGLPLLGDVVRPERL
jgi:putative transposase